TTNSSGAGHFDAILSGSTSFGEYATATATAADGSTSEFSAVAFVDTAPVLVIPATASVVKTTTLTTAADPASDADLDTLTYSVDSTSSTGAIAVLAFQGTDTVEVSGAIGETFAIQESGATSTLIVTGTEDNDTFALANQTITVGGAVIAFNSEAQLTIEALG